MTLDREQTARYERSLLAEGFSTAHMEMLLRGRVAVVGAGGLGSAALNYIVAAGVGHVTIIEDDTISLSNLQRQILYTTSQIGLPKAECAAVRLSQLNPMCDIRTFGERLTQDNASRLLSNHDVVVDCTDNFRTRYIIDGFCRENSIPMVYGTAQNSGGQAAVFNWGKAGSYRELYPEEPPQKEAVGVLPPMTGIIGSIQAMETIKIICRMGDTLDGRVMTFDGLGMRVGTFGF